MGINLLDASFLWVLEVAVGETHGTQEAPLWVWVGNRVSCLEEKLPGGDALHLRRDRDTGLRSHFLLQPGTPHSSGMAQNPDQDFMTPVQGWRNFQSVLKHDSRGWRCDVAGKAAAFSAGIL